MANPEFDNYVEQRKRPLSALLFAGRDLRDKVKSGTKTITIRNGWRDYQVGKTVILCCHLLDWAKMAKITAVTHCKLNEVPLQDFLDDGMEGLGDAIDVLSGFYDDIDENSKVTVIRWQLI